MKTYNAIYKRPMFPRYEYHRELIKKIVDSAHQIDNNIITRDLSKLADSTILVYGRERRRQESLTTTDIRRRKW